MAATTTTTLGFRDVLRSGRFAYGTELVTTRGPLGDDRPQDVVGLARGLLDDPGSPWVSITDNPGRGTDAAARLVGRKARWPRLAL